MNVPEIREALLLAQELDTIVDHQDARYPNVGVVSQEAAAAIRRQQARIQELEAMLEAVGAGGVSAQRVTQAAQAPATAIQERDKFEQLMAASYPNLSFERHSYQYDHNRFEQYKVQWLWEGWQARAALDASDHIEQPIEMVAAPVVLPEPDSYLFQHEDTGQTMFVDAQQVEWGFEANNPRLHKVSGVYTEQQVRELLAAHGIPQKKRSNDKEEQQWQ